MLEKEVSDQNIIENELMVLKKQNEQLESQFQALEEDYLTLEKTKKELEVKLKLSLQQLKKLVFVYLVFLVVFF